MICLFRWSVEGFVAGPIAAFAVIVSAVDPAGRSTALTLSPCHLDDLAEEVRCAVLEVFEDRDTAAGRRIPIHVRHWSIRRAEPLADEPAADSSADPEQAASQAQRRLALAAAIRQLPLGLRQVILLVLEGLSHNEIGDVLGITNGNVAVRATRARQALADAMTKAKETR